MSRMYRENVKSLNWFVGCRFNCIYCLPSFQRQMKRQRKRCDDCYLYRPHAHLERLDKSPPKTGKGEFIFAPSSGDPAFSNTLQMRAFMLYALNHSDVTFLTQSKNPKMAFTGKRIYPNEELPANVLLGTTIETDLMRFETPSPYTRYSEISKAPPPETRTLGFIEVVTVEPILDFTLHGLIACINQCNPSIVYIGYDNHNCKLPEPSLAKTEAFIDELEDRDIEVRLKSIRRAWWEDLTEFPKKVDR